MVLQGKQTRFASQEENLVRESCRRNGLGPSSELYCHDWSLLKRSIIGSYPHVSAKHLNILSSELRSNNRENPYMLLGRYAQAADCGNPGLREADSGSEGVYKLFCP